MTKKAFIEKFKNNDLISDAELLYDLLETSQEVAKSKFGASAVGNPVVTLRTAELILQLETLYDDEDTGEGEE